MQISVLFTGGTIGSGVDAEGVLAPQEHTAYALLEFYRRSAPQEAKKISFTVREPYRILSENLNAKYLNQLAACVDRELSGNCPDGIVVTHGTDTLCYSAAVLAYCFWNAPIPIVLVASDYVLEDPRANGLEHFRCALEFIRAARGTGVFVCHQNPSAFPVVHRASRLLQQEPLSNTLRSVMGGTCGVYTPNGYKANPDWKQGDRKEEIACFFDPVKHLKTESGALRKSAPIVRIDPYVGMEYPELPPGTKAVLFGSYHSGTIPVGKELERFMQSVRERNIPAFLCGLRRGEREYETVGQYRALGIEPLPPSAPIAQYCKLWLALDGGFDAVRVMRTEIADDWV